jgi:hypothetical protein
MGTWQNVRIEVEGDARDTPTLIAICRAPELGLRDVEAHQINRGITVAAESRVGDPQVLAKRIAQLVREKLPNAEVFVRVYEPAKKLAGHHITALGKEEELD